MYRLLGSARLKTGEQMEIGVVECPDPSWGAQVKPLLGHKDRRRVMSDELRKAVIAKNGDVVQTFLVDGFVAGSWSLSGGRVRLEPFGPIPRRAARELKEEAARLEAFVH